jgi:hypothetical protein
MNAMWEESYVNNDPKLTHFDSYIFKMMSVMDMLERMSSPDTFKSALTVFFVYEYKK